MIINSLKRAFEQRRVLFGGTIMRSLVFYVASFLVCVSAYAETRGWTMVDGRTFEAEFSLRMGKDAIFKTASGKVVRIPHDQLSTEDQEFISLAVPPDLDVSFSKMSDKRKYPDGYPGATTRPPSTYYYEFMVKIRQRSAGDYNHPLHLEFFVVGDEIDGNNYILLDRQEREFTLTSENKRSYIARSETIGITRYTWEEKVGSSLVMERGEKYARYLVIITDARGEVIAYRTPNKWLMESAENLRKLPLKRHFDKTGNRVGPPRPPTNNY